MELSKHTYGSATWNSKDQKDENQGNWSLHQKNQKLGQNVRSHDFDGKHSRHPWTIQKTILFFGDEGFASQGDGEEENDDYDDTWSHEFGETWV